MAANSREVEQVVARTLRDSLAKLQQTTGELDQAVSDLVSACASARPSNSLPSMLRARSSAASLAASLEVLSKFVVTSLQSASPAEIELLAALPVLSAPTLQQEVAEPAEPAPPDESTLTEPPVSEAASPRPAKSEPPLTEPAEADAVAPTAGTIEPIVPAGQVPAPAGAPELAIATDSAALEPPVFELPKFEPAFELTAFKEAAIEPAVVEPAAGDQVVEAAPHTAELHELATWKEPPSQSEPDVPEAPADLPKIDEGELPPVAPMASVDAAAPSAASMLSEELPPEAKGFDVLALTPDQQELHRRANRVAKVSMQDVKMLRPRDVALGKEHKDICIRLRDDIEKAHKEYDRRFHTILDHPVDYFYDWMVEILGDGDPETLGQYPYPSPVLRR